jgi:hypothetical protein
MAPHTTEQPEVQATPLKVLPALKETKTIPDIDAAQTEPTTGFQPEDHPIDDTPPLKVG